MRKHWSDLEQWPTQFEDILQPDEWQFWFLFVEEEQKTLTHYQQERNMWDFSPLVVAVIYFVIIFVSPLSYEVSW